MRVTAKAFLLHNEGCIMNQLRPFADDRLLVGCIHCLGSTETRDHVPSRILLDEPYPENLPVIPACVSCNHGFSLDEEYFACLVECAKTGSVDAVQRPKIRRILRDSPGLTTRLTQARSVGDDGTISFAVETKRARNVILKLARGHAAYELNEQMSDAPSHVMLATLQALSPQARNYFETPPETTLWPELGSRAMQRLVVSTAAPSVIGLDWIEVQPGQYRYVAVAEGPVMVRFVLGEYLACEVIWDAGN
jgi:hypothetical protein